MMKSLWYRVDATSFFRPANQLNDLTVANLASQTTVNNFAFPHLKLSESTTSRCIENTCAGDKIVVLQSGCNQLPQTCLANQLNDLTVADLARQAAGTSPLYLVGRYGGGISGSTQVCVHAHTQDC